MTDQEIISALLDHDNQVTRTFFYETFRPMMLGVLRKIFSYPVEYDEAVNELYLYLMKNEAAMLRCYDFKCPLVLWLRLVAIRYFYRQKEQMVEDASYTKETREDLYETEAELQARHDVEALLEAMHNKRYEYIIRRIMLDEAPYIQVASELGITVDNLYNLKHRAMALITDIALNDLPLRAIATHTFSTRCAMLCELYILASHGIRRTESECEHLCCRHGWMTEQGMSMCAIGNMLEWEHFKVSRTFHNTMSHIIHALQEGYELIVVVDSKEMNCTEQEAQEQDRMEGICPNHAIVITSANENEVVLYDPASPNPVTLPVAHFMETWNDSDNYLIKSRAII